MNTGIIDVICETIVRIVHPEQIYLFGSAARGEVNDESDLDIMVVTDHCNDEDVLVRRELYQAGIRIPLDLVYVSPDAIIEAASALFFSSSSMLEYFEIDKKESSSLVSA
ncbi:MAG: nucleotidyltransferase domain-containing protein [Paludibacter sp.]|nr:nucleotidyltransferase domain-containing protein [Paludibacter sp.]